MVIQGRRIEQSEIDLIIRLITQHRDWQRASFVRTLRTVVLVPSACGLPAPSAARQAGTHRQVIRLGNPRGMACHSLLLKLDIRDIFGYRPGKGLWSMGGVIGRSRFSGTAG
jgi:hypothetical protein